MISVIIPYFCTKKEYFDKCMQSILEDDTTDIEVLVIDDGSGSMYHTITDKYLVDSRVKVLHVQHAGVSIARNIGIEIAQGEWITFVDSDDYLEPNAMSVLLAASKDLHADIVYYNGYGDKEGKIERNVSYLKEGIDYAITQQEKNRVLASALSLGFASSNRYRQFFSLGGACCKLIRRSMLLKYAIRYNPKIHFAEDTIFSLAVIQKAEHIVYIDQYLYHYNINNESVTNKYRPGLSNDMDAFFEVVYQFIKANDLKEQLNEAYYLRAYIELQRCIRKEFCHKNNSMSRVERNKKAKFFLRSEPYKTALKRKSIYTSKLKYQVIIFLLGRGLVNMYAILYQMLKK